MGPSDQPDPWAFRRSTRRKPEALTFLDTLRKGWPRQPIGFTECHPKNNEQNNKDKSRNDSAGKDAPIDVKWRPTAPAPRGKIISAIAASAR